MAAQQVAIQLYRLGPKVGPFVDPVPRVLAEWHFAVIRVQPLIVKDFRLDLDEPDLGVRFAGEGFRCWPVHSVWPGVACLPPSRCQLPDSSETSFALHATFLLFLVVTGSTSPASMNSRSADSGMRTCRGPMRTKRMRRSSISRRGKRGLVFSTSAPSATATSRCRRAGTPTSRLPKDPGRAGRWLSPWLR